MPKFDNVLHRATEYLRGVVQRRAPFKQEECLQLALASAHHEHALSGETEAFHQICELAFRSCIAECYADTSAAAHLIDCALEAFEDCTLGAALLEEWAECMPVSQLHVAFHYLTSRVGRFVHDISSTRGHGLVILRLCNEMLRRLSKTKHSIECGHIILFLSAAFPPTERSALNLRGEFNIDNVTPIDAPIVGDTDYSFYAAFWQLQSFIRDPTSAIIPNNWLQIRSTLRELLSRWESDRPLAHGTRLSYPKHLSNRGLFEMQMVDRDFRITILAQLCIFLDHLEQSRGSTTQHALSNEQCAELQSIVQRVHAIVIKDDPSGSMLAQIRMMLSSERSWVSWKLESCPSFERDALPEYDLPHAISYSSEGGTSCKMPYGSGSDSLDELWQMTTDPVKLAESAPCQAVDELLAPLKEQLDPDEGIEEEYRLSRTEEYRWRLLRLVFASPNERPQFVAACSNGPHLEEYLAHGSNE